MSAHAQASGPRSNAYSESKFTNWTEYDPFFAEVRAVYKRFDTRISVRPKFPHVVVIPPLPPNFRHACTRAEVRAYLEQVSPEMRQGLRAVFLLGGTRKQERSWWSKQGCVGMYWRSCVFLFAYPFTYPGCTHGRSLDSWRRFYLDDVLIHELAHHMDRERRADIKTKEGFAYGYVEQKLVAKARKQA